MREKGDQQWEFDLPLPADNFVAGRMTEMFEGSLRNLPPTERTFRSYQPRVLT